MSPRALPAYCAEIIKEISHFGDVRGHEWIAVQRLFVIELQNVKHNKFTLN
jgi:hypothetical protein